MRERCLELIDMNAKARGTSVCVGGDDRGGGWTGTRVPNTGEIAQRNGKWGIAICDYRRIVPRLPTYRWSPQYHQHTIRIRSIETGDGRGRRLKGGVGCWSWVVGEHSLARITRGADEQHGEQCSAASWGGVDQRRTVGPAAFKLLAKLKPQLHSSLHHELDSRIPGLPDRMHRRRWYKAYGVRSPKISELNHKHDSSTPVLPDEEHPSSPTARDHEYECDTRSQSKKDGMPCPTLRVAVEDRKPGELPECSTSDVTKQRNIACNIVDVWRVHRGEDEKNA
ncbi:hypothetical protein BDN71DRAFT_1430221 [Pleurotus eryngii]|uniref:Uncharacterized protein n=1 Tax=Pleurotus eryngii TaxID=5323 RepID=A0A9P6A3A9_PLEER|nr:hypothetical protein BDN71DRAFT_1430221 [Pleurotus eryngii]